MIHPLLFDHKTCDQKIKSHLACQMIFYFNQKTRLQFFLKKHRVIIVDTESTHPLGVSCRGAHERVAARPDPRSHHPPVTVLPGPAAERHQRGRRRHQVQPRDAGQGDPARHRRRILHPHRGEDQHEPAHRPHRVGHPRAHGAGAQVPPHRAVRPPRGVARHRHARGDRRAAAARPAAQGPHHRPQRLAGLRACTRRRAHRLRGDGPGGAPGPLTKGGRAAVGSRRSRLPLLFTSFCKQKWKPLHMQWFFIFIKSFTI